MTKKFDGFVKALEELCRSHKVVLMPDINGDLQVFDADDNGDLIYPVTEDCAAYDWIDANEQKPDKQNYVYVCYEHTLFSVMALFLVTEARWVPANTVVVEHWDKNIVYSVLEYQSEGWYDLDGKPLTHAVTHWRYKNN